MSKSTSTLTFIISITVLIIYTFYILAVKGISGLLLSASVGLITAYYIDEFEIITATIILFGLIYVFIMNVLPKCLEGFETTTPPGLKGQNMCPGNINDSTPVPEGGLQIVDRIAQLSGRKHIPALSQPKPVYSTKGIEGFANADLDGSGEEKTVGQAEKKAKQEENGQAVPDEEAEMAESQPATPLTKNDGEGMVGGGAGGALFKLGEMPSETATGGYVDVGTTLMKAMDSLKPEQVNAMTSETRQLVETQKNLIQMLQSMKPVLQDGRQLLDTFTGIFGKSGGGGGGAVNGTLVGDYRPGVRQ